MVDRFCQQQQAVCAVLAENRKKWHLMPKDSDVANIETVREVLDRISDLTDALSGEKVPTLSSVLPLKWKLFSCLEKRDGERVIAGAMKDQIRSDLASRYEDTQLNIVLNTATYLDPRFKDTFVAMEEEVKEHLFQKRHEASVQPVEQVQTGEQQRQEEGQGGTKRRKTDLKSLLSIFPLLGKRSPRFSTPRKTEIL